MINETRFLKCKVKDTGVGIEKEKMSRLFQMFGLVNENYINNQTGSLKIHDILFQGTGIGLSICKSLCVLLSGDIKVKSKKDFGTAFTFWIKDYIDKKSTEDDIVMYYVKLFE